ncbi:exonuclease subunit SbcD [Shewanella intestini]|uniref:Nuclease SbcCD subunit D n=1 Tax=Shewanella intestini TaxID=2017544 RepID=A0ABS5HYY2_9GAMM|nr:MULTISPECIES: exonuclease subunit SbcD [Shewanella]MBR9726979.1 exonuclease subunit SbcD [Shewanella intestini]MRG34455.1 exonuclease subunit SbcD [Shewanella sp. XMDDZSB0408]
MRILHTSDWHLGQYFYGKSRAAEHHAFMQWLLAQITQYQVDLLIVAGDIFDTTTPPSYARTLYNQFIVDIQTTGCELLILGGNHDSVATLSESKALLSYLNTHVVPGGFATPEQHVLPLYKVGKTSAMPESEPTQPYAIICAMPFLRPRDLVNSESGESGSTKQQKLSMAIAHYYRASFEYAQSIQQSLAVPVPLIATGHLTTVGASSSESVRDIYIGSLDAFNAQHFPAADYIALGHIHRPQQVAKTEHIRYSGSPIPLSFDELPKQHDISGKNVLLVNFEQQKLTDVTPLTVPLFQAMQTIKGNLVEIEQAIDAIAAREQAQDTWLSIEVNHQDYLSDLQQRIAAMTQDKPIEVLQLKRARQVQQHTLSKVENETLAEINIEDVFERRLANEVFETAEEQHKLERIRVKFKQIAAEVEQDIVPVDAEVNA